MPREHCWVDADSLPSGRAVRGGRARGLRHPSQRWQTTSPGDGPPPPPRHAAPTGHAGQGDQSWAPTPTRPRPQHGGGGPKQPAEWAGSRGTVSAWPQTPFTTVEGTPAGDALLPPPQRATPARKGAHCGASAGYPRPHRPHPGHTRRGTPAARPRRRAAGGRTGPDTRRPSQRWQGTPPRGRPSTTPAARSPSKGMQAKGTVLGPHSHTPAPTARGWRTPTARPVGGQSGEGERLTSDAPHSGGRHPPRGRPSATPTASNAGPQGRTLWGRCWVPTPAPTASGAQGPRNPGRPPVRTSGWGRDSA